LIRIKSMKILAILNIPFEAAKAAMVSEISEEGIGYDDAFASRAALTIVENRVMWATAMSGFTYEVMPSQTGETHLTYTGARRGWLAQELLPSPLEEKNIEVLYVEGTYGSFKTEEASRRWGAEICAEEVYEPLVEYESQKAFAVAYAIGAGLVDQTLNKGVTWVGSSPIEREVEKLARDGRIPSANKILWPN